MSDILTAPDRPWPKRTSDTPRVDELDYGDQSRFPGPGYGDLWALARTFERENGRLRMILRRLAYVPAVTQALGNNHTDGCNCPLCDARAILETGLR